MCNSDDHCHITVPPRYGDLRDEKCLPLPPIPPPVCVQSRPGASVSNLRNKEVVVDPLLCWTEDKPMVQKKESTTPQNEDKLLSDKGLSALNNIFRNVSFQGQGHEAEDLQTLLQTFQVWAHELFPHHDFEDLVVHLEQMGTLQTVQTCIKDMLMDMEPACLQPGSADCQGLGCETAFKYSESSEEESTTKRE